MYQRIGFFFTKTSVLGIFFPTDPSLEPLPPQRIIAVFDLFTLIYIQKYTII